jgi:hypothetical protein
MKMYGGLVVWHHLILISALDGGEWPDSRLGRFAPVGPPRYPFDRKLGGPQKWYEGDGEEKELSSRLLPGIEIRSSIP